MEQAIKASTEIAFENGIFLHVCNYGVLCWQDKEWHMSARSFVANEKVIEIADRWLVRHTTIDNS